MSIRNKARADWRALTGAALIGSGVGLALGAAYMAGGMARAAGDHARATRLAEAAAGGFSESVLQREAAAMDAGMLRIARRHDPFTVAGAAERDRQSAILAARLENGRLVPAEPTPPARLSGALDASRELECLTQAVYFEARGEGPAGQAAVAQVVMNRVRHSAFPKTVCGVVYQGASRRTGCQFSFACDGSMNRRRETAAWERARKVAARALSGAAVASVGDATHFHTINVAPNWGPRLIRTAQVGLHVFYKFGRASAVRHLAEAQAPAPEEAAEPFYATLTSAPVTAAPAEAVDAEFRLTSAVAVEGDKPIAAQAVATPAAETKPAAKPAKPAQPPAAPATKTAKPVKPTAEATAKLAPASKPRSAESPAPV